MNKRRKRWTFVLLLSSDRKNIIQIVYSELHIASLELVHIEVFTYRDENWLKSEAHHKLPRIKKTGMNSTTTSLSYSCHGL